MIADVSRGLPASRIKQQLLVLENKIREAIGNADILIHPHPVDLSSESVMERARQIAAHHGFAIHHIFAHSTEGHTCLNFDLEVDAGLTLKLAHEITDHLESEIRREIDPSLEINIHIEPLLTELMAGEAPSEELQKDILSALKRAATLSHQVSDIHDVKILSSSHGVIVSAHGYADAETPITQAHSLSDTIEHLLKAEVPQVVRLILHLEPQPFESGFAGCT
jgi:divalent metal cation (Fe/Co/Zn/Cd) transporter